MPTKEGAIRMRQQKEELITQAKKIDAALADYPKRYILKRERMDRVLEHMLADFALTLPEEFCKRMGTEGLRYLIESFEEVDAS